MSTHPSALTEGVSWQRASIEVRTSALFVVQLFCRRRCPQPSQAWTDHALWNSYPDEFWVQRALLEAQFAGAAECEANVQHRHGVYDWCKAVVLVRR